MRNDFIGLKTTIELKFQTVKAPYFGTVEVFFYRVAKTLFNFFYSVLCNDKKNEYVFYLLKMMGFFTNFISTFFTLAFNVSSSKNFFTNSIWLLNE